MLFLRRENPGVIHVGCDIHVMWVSPGPVDTAPTRFCRAPNTSRSLAACVVPSAHLQVAAGQLRGPGTGGPGAAPAGPGAVRSSCLRGRFLLQMTVPVLLSDDERCFNTSFVGT